MSDINKKQIFMVLYNYYENDYSIVIIMNTIDKAIKYINNREMNDNEYTNNFTPFEQKLVNSLEDIYNTTKRSIAIVSNDIINNISVRESETFSQFVIVPMDIN
jgi:phosphopantetheine adenylyltransferase